MPSVTFTTPGSGTWTSPSGVTSVKVECWGGGATGSGGGGDGGGGGGYASSTLSVIPGNTYNFVVGAGGTFSGITPANGNDSTWESSITARGGEIPGGGGLSPTNIGDITFNGGSGFSGSSTAGGGGSAFPDSNGNNGQTTNGGVGQGNGGTGPSGNGIAPGGGGAYSSGNGATGQIIVSWGLASLAGDPWFVGFDGKMFEFHGQQDRYFNLYQDRIVTVNAKFVSLMRSNKYPHPFRGYKTYIGEVGLIHDKKKIKITPDYFHKSLPIFGEHKVKADHMLKLKSFKQLQYNQVNNNNKVLPSALNFIGVDGAITGSYSLNLQHGNVVVGLMEYYKGAYLNVTLNLLAKKATGIIGQTLLEHRRNLWDFQIDHLFQKQSDIQMS